MEGHDTYERECVAVGHEWKMAFEEEKTLKRASLWRPPKVDYSSATEAPRIWFLTLCASERKRFGF